MEIGSLYHQDGSCRFVLWAPAAHSVELELAGSGRCIPMAADEAGYHRAVVDAIALPERYFYRFNSSRFPDPASGFQPEGVHGPSEVVNHRAYAWGDQGWAGIPQEALIIYELHTGTFTPEGTFSSIEERLDDLIATGITAIELMPVAQFPGSRNWGYDQAYPFAVQNSYGGPQELKHLVDTCHQKGLAVLLDVVYNHFGPEGAYIGQFGPYFTEKYKTPWGSAVNLDDRHSDEVRNYFIENALYWFRHYHMDGLRLDAVHALYDFSAQPFLQELARRVALFCHDTGKKHYLIAESDLNDAHLIRTPEQNGFGLDAQWCDDFHHSLHSLLTGENRGYYESFGHLRHFEKAYASGFVYEGEYSPYRRRRYGSSAAGLPPRRFVVCAQNHDQVGNRMLGERLPQLVSFEQLKLAAAAVMLSPFIPLLFMGEEYGEDAPFLYFVDHGDPGLVEAVRRGRAEEFAGFIEACPPPDPQNELTFLNSRLRWDFREHGRHGVLLSFYRELIALRKQVPALGIGDRQGISTWSGEQQPGLLEILRWHEQNQVLLFFNFSGEMLHTRPVPAGRWRRVLDSAEKRWLGAGTSTRHSVEIHAEAISPLSIAVYCKEATP